MDVQQTEAKIIIQIVQINEEEHTQISCTDSPVIDRKDTENEKHLKEQLENHCNKDTEQYLDSREEGNEI